MDEIKNLAINLGSTSTKIAYFINGVCQLDLSIKHDPEIINSFTDIWDQYVLRRQVIEQFMKENGIRLEELNAISSRGGHTEPREGGTYVINEEMIKQNRSGKYGVHIGNIGLQIAYDLACECPSLVPLTTDLPTTDEFAPLARYSGLEGIKRTCRMQVLNHKAMSRAYADSIGKRYEDLNLVVAMLGGGITVAAHNHGKIIDATNGLDGDGCFSNNRSGGLPVGSLIELCFSGQYSKEELLHKVNGEGGLLSYTGTTDTVEIERRAESGDKEAKEALQAMCYQAAKDIGAYATVLEGKVDAVLLTGGMANSRMITDEIKKRVSFIAPVIILPGEKEMESLGLSAYRVLTGQEELKRFVPSEVSK